MSKQENTDNYLINKYYIKLLLEYDEYQLGIEPKTGFEHLKIAEKLNHDILVAKHNHHK